MPRFSKDVPVSESDQLDFVEARMRAALLEARRLFEMANTMVAEVGDPENQMAVFGRFNATMRRLMKGGDEEWLKPDRRK